MKSLKAGVLAMVFLLAATAAYAEYGGIWKNADQTINIWLSEHDTRAMTAVRTPDLTAFESFLDSDFTNGFDAMELSGLGSRLQITFTGDTTATCTYTPSGGSPVVDELTKSFGGAYCGFVFATGGLFSDPEGLTYRLTASSPFNIGEFKVANGDDLIVYEDSFVRVYGDNAYFIGRYGSDTVTVMKATELQADPVVQYSVGPEDTMGDLDLPTPQASTNPHDMVFLSESTAYMSFAGASAILKLNPLTGERLALIDVSAYCEGDDELPEASPMAKVGQYIYVALKRQDRNNSWKPDIPVIIKIDTETDTIVDLDPVAEGVQGITLSLRNPSAMEYVEARNELYLSCTGDSNDAEVPSGVQIIDVLTDTVKGAILTPAETGYRVSILRASSASKAYIIGYDDSADWPWPYFLSEVDLNSGQVVDDKFHSVDYYIPDMALGCKDCGCRLFVLDRSDEDPGIWIFETQGNTLLGKAQTMLPLAGMAVMER